MTRAVTPHDETLAAIGEEVRQLVGPVATATMEAHVAAGTCPDLAADACATGLIAVACGLATSEHEPGCEVQRAYLHAAVDCLFDQLTAFDRGQINEAGETVQ